MAENNLLEPLVEAMRRELETKTQAELATELDIHQTTVSSIIRGNRRIGFRALNAILAARPQWAKLLSDNGDE